MKKWSRTAIPIICLCAAEGASAETLACSPDVPAIAPGQSVTLRAFSVVAGAGGYLWKADRNSIDGNAAEVRWSSEGLPPGIYQISVSLAHDSRGSCQLRLLVTEEARSPAGGETGSGFLTPNQSEQRGYALYSYLLFGAAPIDSNRERYLATLAAYLRLVPRIEDLKRNIRASEINATYVPLDAPPPKDPSAAWLLDHYDFGRARALLRLFPGQLREGPYFVSAATPLTGAETLSGRYLLQNLSAVPTEPKDLPAWWVREFLNQAAQQRYWDTSNLEQFTLKLRTTLAVLSAGLPDVRASIKDWVSWR